MRAKDLTTKNLKAEDRHPNAKPFGPESPPEMPQGTVKVDVSDVYDWYKLGMHLSDLEGLGKHDFGQGPPQTILSFGSEELEHMYLDALEKLGLTTHDIDPDTHPGSKKEPQYGYKVESLDEATYTGNLGWMEISRLFMARPELKPKFLEVKEKHGIEKAFMWAAEQLGVKLQPIISKEQGVTEGLGNNEISFKVQKGKNKFATTLSINNKPAGVYQYDATTGRSIAEVYPEFKGKGFGKILVLHAIYTAAKLGLDFVEDESRTAEYDNVLDSLSSNGYIVDDDGYWYVTNDGEQYLNQSLKQGVAESASGYIPSKKQANDPRFKTALTVDVKPDTIKKNAKAFGFKVSRAGIPPLLREDIHSSEDLKDVASWMNTTPDKLEITLKQEPIEKFIKQIREMYGTFDENPEDEERTNRILKLLKRGAEPLPIYVEADDKDLFVMEGRHRMVAFWLNKIKTIPVAYVSVKEKVSEQKNADKITAYHGTRRDLDKFKPFSHFGTFRAAYDRLDHTRQGDPDEIEQERIYQVELNITNPIKLDVDIYDNHKLNDWVDLMQRIKVIDSEESQTIKTSDDLLKLLLDKGYDSIQYKNRWEHPGSTSYVILKPNQVRIKKIIPYDQFANAKLDEGWREALAGLAMGASLGANADVVKVMPGDTVYSIAKTVNASPGEIARANKLDKNFTIKPGQQLRIPDSKPAAAKPAQPEKTKDKPAAKTLARGGHEQILIRAARQAGITDRTELAALLAQAAHETHDFKSMVEYGGSLDFRKYDPKYAPKKAKLLGNTRPGEGARYKGRGYIQLTGKYNYKIAGEALGLDLVNKPELVEQPEIAAKVAVWFWKTRVQPNVSDFNDVTAVTKPINPSLNNLDDRKLAFAEYKRAIMAA